MADGETYDLTRQSELREVSWMKVKHIKESTTSLTAKIYNYYDGLDEWESQKTFILDSLSLYSNKNN